MESNGVYYFLSYKCRNPRRRKKIINKVKPRLAIITHFGIKMLKADPLYEAREIQNKTGVQIISAKDGMTIDPISYSSGLRQKTLKMYK